MTNSLGLIIFSELLEGVNLISSFIGKASFGFATISLSKLKAVELPLTVVCGICCGT